MKAYKTQLHLELIEEMYHPHRIQKYLEAGGELEEYLY
jgi:hypothetical protein